MMIKVSKIASTLSPMPPKKAWSSGFGAVSCALGKRGLSFVWKQLIRSKFSQKCDPSDQFLILITQTPLFVTVLSGFFIAIRDAKISPCFGSSNNSLAMNQIHPVVPSSPDPPDLQVAVQVQELPHRHGVMLSAASELWAGNGLAVGCPGGSSPVLSTNH